jgi:oligopeptide/dipeptide ABC transporter ATP-binding protein
MYLGEVVESGPVASVLQNPKHPYTKALLEAVPIADPVRARCRSTEHALQGDLPNPFQRPTGCVLSTRCPRAEDRCHREKPSPSGDATHWATCHFPSLTETPSQQEVPSRSPSPVVLGPTGLPGWYRQ